MHRVYYFDIEGFKVLLVSADDTPREGETIVLKRPAKPPFEEYTVQEVVRDPVQRQTYVVCVKRRTAALASGRMAIILRKIEEHDANGS